MYFTEDGTCVDAQTGHMLPFVRPASPARTFETDAVYWHPSYSLDAYGASDRKVCAVIIDEDGCVDAIDTGGANEQ